MAAPTAREQEVAERSWAVPWGLLDVLGVLAVTVAAVYVLATGIAVLATAMDVPDEVARVLLPLPLAVLALVTLAWVALRHRAVRRLAGPGPARPREVLVGLAWGLGGFVAVNVVLVVGLQVAAGLAGAELPQPQEQLHEAAADPALVPWLVISAAVVAPLAEELFFRGMLFQALRRRLSRWWAIGLSGVVFAAVHVLAELTWAAGVLVFWLILPLGLFLGWLFDRRGTLLTPIVVHAAFNLATVGAMLLA